MEPEDRVVAEVGRVAVEQSSGLTFAGRGVVSDEAGQRRMALGPKTPTRRRIASGVSSPSVRKPTSCPTTNKKPLRRVVLNGGP